MNPFTQGRDPPPARPRLYIDTRGAHHPDSARQSPEEACPSAWGRAGSQLQLSVHSHSRSASDPVINYDLPESPHVVANTPWPEMPMVHSPSPAPSRASVTDENDWFSVENDKRRVGEAAGSSPFMDSAFQTPLPSKSSKLDRQHGQRSIPSYGQKSEAQRSVPSYGADSQRSVPSYGQADRYKTAGGTPLQAPSSRAPSVSGGPDSHCCGGHTCLAVVVHYIALLFAEYPRKSHREWSGAVVRPVDSSGEMGDMASMECGSIQRRLFLARPKASFQPLENLEEMYGNNPKRRRLVYALRRKKAGSGYQGLWDHVKNEMFIWGELCFDRCTPQKLRNHMPWFTAIFIMVNFITFAFMAGEYSSLQDADENASRCGPSSFVHGPAGLAQWVVDWGSCHKFSAPYLILWGARYGPNLDRGQAYRWFSSMLIADDFIHLVTSMLLMCVVSLHVERRYGTSRTLLLAFLAACGGAFFSAAFESNCKVALSGSGCSFGLLGLFVLDLAFNFDSVRFPVARALLATASLVLFIIANVLDGSPYRLATVGGLLCGLLPGALFLPHIKSEKYEWFIPFAALFTMLGFLLALPLYVYLDRLQGLHC